MTFTPEPLKRQSEMLRALRQELAAKDLAFAHQQWMFKQLLESKSWRWSAPIRWIARVMRGLPPGDPVSVPRSVTAPAVDQPFTNPDSALDVKAVATALARVSLETFLNSGRTLNLEAPPNPAVSTILVLFNRAELTLGCLRSIAECGEPGTEVILVDNASTDETATLLERVRGAKIIRNLTNLNFLLAVNEAARECRGEYILLLNNDAQLLPGSLASALATMRTSERVGAVGGKIVLLDGTLQEAGNIVWRDGSCLGYGRGDNPFAPAYMFRRDVDYCSAAFLLTPRAVWEQLHGFDEAYIPAYYEETDYCLRLWENGLRVVYEPCATVIHYEFASSQSSEAAVALQAQHQTVLEARHRGTLHRHAEAREDRIVYARSRHEGPRVLFVDDCVPHRWLGSGFPRAQALLRSLLKYKCHVTLYPLAVTDETWDRVYADFPFEIEVMMGMDRSLLESFLRARAGYYDYIIVSRPHNMRALSPLIAAHPDWFTETKLIYDAEALAAPRTIGMRRLAGEPLQDEAADRLLADEINVALAASIVLCVSEDERQTLVKHGVPFVEVVGHSLDVTPSPQGFENRMDFLFVGAMHEDPSPNADSMIWFLEEIFPRIRESLGDVRLTITGINNSPRVRSYSGPYVSLAGHLPDLAELYARTRVFIAPTRVAAGIPHKVHEAAARGLPVVATSLLANQLGWSSRELAIADTAESFAMECIEVYRNRNRWLGLREAAMERVRHECSPEAFHRAVGRFLGKAEREPVKAPL